MREICSCELFAKNSKASSGIGDRITGEQKMKYIVEHDISGMVRGCETVEDIQRYLNTDPHPEHRLVSLTFNYGGIILIWELKDKMG